MDASSKFNSPETDPRATVPLVSREENPPPLSSVVTSASALTKIALLVSSNKLVPLLRLESPRPKMAVLRDSATLNSRKSMMPRELSINSTVKTSTDVVSDLIYQPTEVVVEVEAAEAVEVIVVDAVAVSEVVVEAVASAAAVVEATDSEAAATGLSVTEEAVAASEEAAMATEEVTDHLTVVTVTEEEEVIVHTEVIANAALVVIAAVTDVADSAAAVVVVSEEIVAEVAVIETVVVEEVSNGIE